MVKSKPGPCPRCHCWPLLVPCHYSCYPLQCGDEAASLQPPSHQLPTLRTPHPELGLKIKQWIRPIKSRHWSTINMYAGVVRHTYLASFWYLSLYKYPKYTYEHSKYTYYQNILMKRVFVQKYPKGDLRDKHFFLLKKIMSSIRMSIGDIRIYLFIYLLILYSQR